jgi:hypothetical protein
MYVIAQWRSIKTLIIAAWCCPVLEYESGIRMSNGNIGCRQLQAGRDKHLGGLNLYALRENDDK